MEITKKDSQDAKQEDLVTIIVPAHNVEPFIQKCILSALNQDYQSIEVIAIDDGSSDGTGAILDSIALISKKLKTIHQHNSGVSAARNRGLDESNGDYIVFLDGDDYLAPSFVSTMLSLAQHSKSPFCFSKICFVKNGEKDELNHNEETITHEKALGLLLSPNIIVGCWNKIYKKDFLKQNKIRFNETLFYGEGLNFITECAQKADTVTVCSFRGYYYRQNNYSSATSTVNIPKIVNGWSSLKLIKERVDCSEDSYAEKMFRLHSCLFCAGAITRISVANAKKDNIVLYRSCKKYLKQQTKILLFQNGISPYRKAILLASIMCPKIVGWLDKKRYEKKKRNSI